MENGVEMNGNECSVVASEKDGSGESGGDVVVHDNTNEIATSEGVTDGVTEGVTDEEVIETQDRMERLSEEREEVKRLLKALSALLQGFSTSKID